MIYHVPEDLAFVSQNG